MQVNGRDLYVEMQGAQNLPVVVLLHHGLGSVRAWKHQIPALSAAGYHVIAYDRWGYGRSDPRPQLSIPYFEEDVEELEILLDSLGVERAVLVGHSDGGTVALYFAACRPDRINGLVTVAAHIYVEPEMETGIQAVRQTYEQDEFFRTALHSMHGAKTDAVFWGWFNGWHREENRTWDMRQALQQITCPVLVVQGVEDEHATPQQAKDIAASIPNAQLWLVEQARHMLPQDYAQPFNQRLLAFLGTLD